MDVQNLMKQAQKMQSKMQEIQDSLSSIIVCGESGGGVVQVKMNCKVGVKLNQS